MLRTLLTPTRSLRQPLKCLLRTLTTHNTITDQTTGKVITLTDPARPEMGDYPNPAPVYAFDRDPYAKYDDQQNRRNFNDPINFDVDLYDMWSPDRYDSVSISTALKHNAIFFGLFIGITSAVAYFQLNPEKPAMPRSYPYGGLAKELGSGKPSDDVFYRVSPDHTADENGILPANPIAQEQQRAYLEENARFVNV